MTFAKRCALALMVLGVLSSCTGAPAPAGSPRASVAASASPSRTPQAAPSSRVSPSPIPTMTGSPAPSAAASPVLTPAPRTGAPDLRIPPSGNAVLAAFAASRTERGLPACVPDPAGQAALERYVRSTLSGLAEGQTPTLDPRGEPGLSGAVGSVLIVPRGVAQFPRENISLLTRTNAQALYAAGPRYCYAAAADLTPDRAIVGIWVR